MNIADQIADILQKNPKGLKASEIASQIGCTRKTVNSYLYAHKNTYEQHDGYIWTAKSAKKNTPPALYNTVAIPTTPYSVSIQQNAGITFISTLTITPNGTGYQISSTNNQIICCDCNKFISVHAPSCPFCGCPVHYIADTYYKRYGAEAIQKAQQQQEQQRAEGLKRQQAEQERKHNVARNCFLNNNDKGRSWKLFKRLCDLETEVFERSIEHAKLLNKDPNITPQLTDDQWFRLIVSDNWTYNQTLQELRNVEATRKNNALQAADICKKNHVSEHITRLLAGGQYTADEVQARIDAARYFSRTYPHLELDAEQFMLLSVEEIKSRVYSLLKSFPEF